MAQWRSADTNLTHRSLDLCATLAMQELTVTGDTERLDMYIQELACYITRLFMLGMNRLFLRS